MINIEEYRHISNTILSRGAPIIGSAIKNTLMFSYWFGMLSNYWAVNLLNFWWSGGGQEAILYINTEVYT